MVSFFLFLSNLQNLGSGSTLFFLPWQPYAWRIVKKLRLESIHFSADWWIKMETSLVFQVFLLVILLNLNFSDYNINKNYCWHPLPGFETRSWGIMSQERLQLIRNTLEDLVIWKQALNLKDEIWQFPVKYCDQCFHSNRISLWCSLHNGWTGTETVKLEKVKAFHKAVCCLKSKSSKSRTQNARKLAFNILN